jgi:hypothetical protein
MAYMVSRIEAKRFKNEIKDCCKRYVRNSFFKLYEYFVSVGVIVYANWRDLCEANERKYSGRSFLQSGMGTNRTLQRSRSVLINATHILTHF